MKLKHYWLFGVALATWFASLSAFSAPTETLRIVHSPVTLAVRGQDVLFRAQVVPGAQPVKNATLYYAVSRDAAPYKVAMQDSGAGWFTGSISANMTADLKQILYYVEARDAGDTTAETPWYTIVVKGTGAESPTTNPSPSSVTGKAPEEKGSSWTKPALIAGGVILAGGAALALAGGGGGGSGGSSSTDGATNNAAGTYSGTVTTCVQPPGSGSTCSSHAMTIFIDGNGIVSSDALYEGKHLQGKLSGNNFLLVASVTATNGTGDIQFLGTVVNNSIAGSIQGTLTTTSGTGTYSGNFSAVK